MTLTGYRRAAAHVGRVCEVRRQHDGSICRNLAGQTAVLNKTNSFNDKFERYIAQDRHNPDLRRKAYTAIAAKMARTIHAVIKSGEPYRPFFEGTSPGGRTPLWRAVEAGS